MKRISFILILLFMFSISVYAKIEITFKSTLIDFGEIENGKITDILFEFKNTGDELLVIKKVNSTCGCTVAKIEKKEYKPGEEGKIPVKFNSRGYRGKVTKTIIVITNSKINNGYTRLRFTGKVKLGDVAQCRVFPDKIFLKNVFMGNTETRKIAVTNTGTVDLKILEFIHNPALILSINKSVIKPKESAELTIAFNPFEIGNFSSFIKIRTNQYGRAVTLIRFRAFVKNKE